MYEEYSSCHKKDEEGLKLYEGMSKVFRQSYKRCKILCELRRKLNQY